MTKIDALYSQKIIRAVEALTFLTHQLTRY